MKAKETLTPSEVEERTGIKQSTLQYWRNKKQGPRYLKIGKRVYYPLVELRLWLRQHMIRTSTMEDYEVVFGKEEHDNL